MSAAGESCEVLIVGGGPHGLATAFELARLGVTGIVVLDGPTIGAGDPGAGVVPLWTPLSGEAEARLAAAVAVAWERLPARLDADLPTVARPQLELAHSAVGVAGVVARAELAASHGIAARRLHPGGLADRCPALSLTGDGGPPVLGGLLRSDGRAVAAGALEWAYARSGSLRGAGVALRRGVTVQALERVGERIVAARTDAGRIAVNHVVGTGPAAGELCAQAGLALPLDTEDAAACLTEALAPLLDFALLAPELGVRLVPTQRGEIALGPAGGADAGPRAAGEPAAAGGGLRRLIRRGLTLLPGLEPARLARVWTEAVERTADGAPLAGRTPVENLYVSTAWGGAGPAVAPVVGAALAELVAGGAASELLAPFAVERFAVRPGAGSSGWSAGIESAHV